MSTELTGTIDSAPPVAETLARLALRREQVTKLEGRVRKFDSALNPSVESAGSISVTERLEAQVGIAGARSELATAQLAEVRARADVDTAREAERTRRLTGLAEAKRRTVRELASRLRAAAVPNQQLAELEDRERELSRGSIADPIAWPMLMESTAEYEALLDHWLAGVRAQGLLD